jgi:multiple sugar transport system substrate-binding protein
MNTKKITRVISSSILAIGLITVPVSFANAAPVEITYSNWQFAEPGRGEALQKLIDEFNASQTKVKVKSISYPYASYATTILTQMGARSGPDVVALEIDVFQRAHQARLVAALPTLKAPKSGFAIYDKNYIKSGKRYGATWQSTGYTLICNKKLLAAAGITCPKTYEEFKAAAAATTVGTTQYGFAFRNTMTQTSGWWYDLSNFVYGFGGRWTDAKGNPTINSALVQKAVTEYKDFFDKKYVPQGLTATEYRRLFWEEKIAMQLDNEAFPAVYIAGNPAIKDNLVIERSPFPKDANAQILIGTHVNANSKKQVQARAFINWLVTDASQIKLMDAMTASAVASKAGPSAALVARAPWLKDFQKYAPNGVLVLPQGAELATDEIRTIVLTQVEKILRSGVSVKDGLDAAQKSVKELLGK